MIELTWLQMAHPEFNAAVQAIWNCPNLEAQTSYAAHRIQKQIEKADKEIKQLRMDLCDKYGKKDDNGKLVTDERNFITFKSPEDNKKFEKEFTAEFQKRKVVMKVTKIDFHQLTQVRGITPRHWEFLEPIVENLPPMEEPEETVEVDTTVPKGKIHRI